MAKTVEVICTLNDEEFQQRRAWVRQNIAPHLVSIEKTDRGLCLTYPATDPVRTLVEEFAALERQCCGEFLDFSFDDKKPNQFDLLITGPVEVQDILQDLKQRIEKERAS